jgi:hypothetical protein
MEIVFLILDNLRMHHCKPVKAWLVELNTNEKLNADWKQALGSRVQVRTKDKLNAVTENYMNTRVRQLTLKNRVFSFSV